MVVAKSRKKSFELHMVSRVRPVFRLRLELLEQRRMLSIVTWTGNAGTLNWSDQLNWSGNALPGPADQVEINSSAGPVTHDSGSDFIDQLNSQQPVVLGGGTLTVSGLVDVENILTINGGTLAQATVLNSVFTPVTVGLSGGSLDGVTLEADLNMTGAGANVRVMNGLTVDGTVTVGASRRLEFGDGFTAADQTLSGTGSIVLTNGFLESDIPNSNQLTIAPGFVIQAHNSSSISFDGSAGSRILNQGDISVVQSGDHLTIGPGGGFNNSAQATITVTAGAILTIESDFFQNDGSVSATGGSTLNIFDNWSNTSGDISATDSILNLGEAGPGNTWSSLGTIEADNSQTTLAGSFTTPANFSRTSSGVVNLTGTMNNASRTLTLDSSSGPWNLVGGTITGGTLTQSAGDGLIATSSGGTLDGVAINGDLDLQKNSNATMTVLHGLTLKGTAFIGALNGSTIGHLIFGNGSDTSSQTLSSTATIVFGQSSLDELQNNIIGPGSLTFATGANIHGVGGLIFDTHGASTINQGTITADAGVGNLTVVNIDNQGTLTTTSGSLNVVGGFKNEGSISATFGQLGLGDNGPATPDWVNTGTIVANTTGLNISGKFTTAELGTLTNNGSTVNLLGTLNNTSSNFALNASLGSWNLQGGTILGGTIIESGGSKLLATSAGGTLDGVTINGDLDLTQETTNSLQVDNSLTVNGTIFLGNTSGTTSGNLTFSSNAAADQVLSGTATVLFGGSHSNILQSDMVSPNQLRLAAGVLIHGNNGSIQTLDVTDSITNQGTISADVADGFILFSPGTLVNQGTLNASDGNLNFAGTVRNVGSAQLTSTPAGSVSTSADFLGNTTNATGFAPQGSVTLGNFLGGTPLFEAMSGDLGASQAGFTQNFDYGALTIDSGSSVQLVDQDHNSSTPGNEAVYANSLTLPLGSTLDLNGLNLYVHSFSVNSGTVINGTVTVVSQNNVTWDGGGDGVHWSDAENWSGDQLPGSDDNVTIASAVGTVVYDTINDTISSLHSLVPLTLAGGALTVNGTVQVDNVFLLQGGDLENADVLPGSNSEPLIATNSGGLLRNVTMDADLDLTRNQSGLDVLGTFVLNGIASVGTPFNVDASILEFGDGATVADQTISGSGSIILAGGLIRNDVPGGAVLNISPNFVIHGFGTIDSHDGHFGGTIVNKGVIQDEGDLFVEDVVNQGMVLVANGSTQLTLSQFNNQSPITISTNAGVTVENTFTNSSTFAVTGGSLVVGATSLTNTGTISATNATTSLSGNFTTAELGIFSRSGGTVSLTGTLDNTGDSLDFNATTGSWFLSGGKITGGTLSETGGAGLIATAPGGTLDGVTVNGDLDLRQNDALLFILDGLVLNGTAFIGADDGSTSGTLQFGDGLNHASEQLSGAAIVQFGSGLNSLVTELVGGVLTLDSTVAIRGKHGSIFGPVGDSIVNLGTVSANNPNSQFSLFNVAFNGSSQYIEDPNARVEFDNDLLGSTQNAIQYNPKGTTVLNGHGTVGTPQLLETMSADQGAIEAGFTNNFDYGRLLIGGDAVNPSYVQLIDASQNSSSPNNEAVYTGTLIVQSGSTLDLAGLNLYTHSFTKNGTVINGTVTIVPNAVHWTGAGDGIHWSDANNWSGNQLPGPGDDVSILTSPNTVVHDSDSDSIADLHSTVPFTLSGGILAVSGTLQVDNTFTLSGGVLANADVLPGNSNQGITATIGGGILDGVTLDANLDLRQNASFVRVMNGLVLNGTAVIGDQLTSSTATLFFGDGSTVTGQTVSGSGSILIDHGAIENDVPSNASLTIASGFIVVSQSGTISNGFNGTIINQGTIQSQGGLTFQGFTNQGSISVTTGGASLALQDFTNQSPIDASAGGPVTLSGTWSNSSTITVAGGTFDVGTTGTAWTNTGTITATDSTINFGGSFTTADVTGFIRSGGTVNLVGALDNTAATLNLNSLTGSWNLHGGTILAGTLSESGGAKLIATNSGGILASVTIDGDLDLSQVNNATLTIFNGSVLNGTAFVGSDDGSRIGTLQFGTGLNGIGQPLGGTGTILFGGNLSNALLVNLPNAALTLGSGITLRGKAGALKNPSNSTIAVLGTIAADSPGSQIILDAIRFDAAPPAPNNPFTLTEDPAATLAFTANLLGNTQNAAQFNPQGTVLFNGQATVASPQLLEAMSADQGAVPAGFAQNFDYGTLTIGDVDPTYVRLVNQDTNAPLANNEAVYVESLTVNALSTLDLNGLHLYTHSLVNHGSITGGTVTVVARTVTWTGAGDGTHWSDANNWSGNQLPGPNDDVVINSAIGTVVHDSGTDSIKSLHSTAPLTINGGTLAVSGTVQVDNIFTLTGASLANATILPGSGGHAVNVVGSFDFDNITLNADLDMPGDGDRLIILNDFVLNGTARLGTAGNSTHAAIQFGDGPAGPTTSDRSFSGTGTLVLDDAAVDSLTAHGAKLIIGAGITIDVVNGDVVNGLDGAIEILGNIVAEAAAVLDLNLIRFDGAAKLSEAPNTSVFQSDSLLGSTQNAAGFSPLGRTTFDGSGTATTPQLFEAMSSDLGAVPSGFTNNFDYGAITIGTDLIAPNYVKLVDQDKNSGSSNPEAVYSNSLTVNRGGTLDLNGLHFYTHSLVNNGSIINGDVTVVPLNDSIDRARDIDALFNLNQDPNIGNQTTNTSTTIPHATVTQTGQGSIDYYSFTVPNENTTAIFDVDFALNDGESIDTQIFLYDQNGNLLGSADDSNTSFGAGGSISSNDPYLEHTFLAGGIYVIGIARAPAQGNSGGISGTPIGLSDSYTLQVSIPGHSIPHNLFGVVFIDNNFNGIQDFGEVGVPGTTVNIITVGSVNFSTVTDSTGAYQFLNLNAGVYTVSEVPPAGLEPSHSFSSVTLAPSDSITTVNLAVLPPEIKISVAGISHPEGNAGTTPFVFTVTLSSPAIAQVTVAYTTQDGSAIGTGANRDYVPVVGTLTFAVGESTKTITVNVLGDVVNELDETFFVTLSNPTGPAQMTDPSSLGTIVNDDALPTVLVSNVSLLEGNFGVTDFVFTISLSAPSSQQLAVGFVTADGTAVSLSDYGSTAGTITFAPFETSKTITVLVHGDTLFENDEFFQLNLSDATPVDQDSVFLPTVSGTSPGQTTAIGTILNDDEPPAINLSNVESNEGDSGTTPFVFTVSLSAVSGVPVVVNFNTGDGVSATATAGVDYQPVSGRLTFAPGVTEQTITVRVLGDQLVEPDETFRVNLFNPIGAVLLQSSAQGLIDDDDTSSFFINHPVAPEGNSDTTPFVFTIDRNNLSDRTLVVVVQTVDGSARLSDHDYIPLNTTLTYAPGVESQQVTVFVNGDSTAEPDEDFQLLVSPITGGATNHFSGQGIILNDDTTLPTGRAISIYNVQHFVPNAGSTPYVFTVHLSATSAQTVTVGFTTVDGTASADHNDYIPTSGTLTFAPGATTQTVTVQVLGKTSPTDNETFEVVLSEPRGADIAVPAALGTIIDASDVHFIEVDDVSRREGDSGHIAFVFTVRVNSVPLDDSVVLPFQTGDIAGGAMAGVDYVPTSGTLTFFPSSTSQTVTVFVNGDMTNEPDESFALNFGIRDSGLPFPIASAAGHILNDDSPPAIAITDVTVTPGSTAMPMVTIYSDKTGPIIVTYTTKDGTAVASEGDYSAVAGTLTFMPGVSRTIPVLVSPTAALETSESFQVLISTVSGDEVISAQGTVTVIPSPLLSSLAGFVFADGNKDGIRQSNEAGIPDVTITVSGKTRAGNPISAQTVTDKNGAYNFVDLPAGSYRLSESLPLGFIVTKNHAGSLDGNADEHGISENLLPGQNGTNYNFGLEFQTTPLPPPNPNPNPNNSGNNSGGSSGPSSNGPTTNPTPPIIPGNPVIPLLPLPAASADSGGTGNAAISQSPAQQARQGAVDAVMQTFIDVARHRDADEKNVDKMLASIADPDEPGLLGIDLGDDPLRKTTTKTSKPVIDSGRGESGRAASPNKFPDAAGFSSAESENGFWWLPTVVASAGAALWLTAYRRRVAKSILAFRQFVGL